MVYTPKTWQDGVSGGTPITAAALNHLETQYAEAVAYTDGKIVPAPVYVPPAGLRGLRGMVPVAPRAATSTGNQTNGTNTFVMTQTRHPVTSTIGNIAPVFANFLATNGQRQETPGPSTITVRGSVLVPVDRTTTAAPQPAGDPYLFVALPAHFLTRARVGDFIVSAYGTAREEVSEIKLVNTGNSYIELVTNRTKAAATGDVMVLLRAAPLYFGGSRDAILPPGSWRQAEPVTINHRGPLDAVPYFWTRTLATVAAGGVIPLNSYAHLGDVPSDGVETGTTSVDKTTSGYIAASTFSWGYGPSAIVGTNSTNTKVWAVRGDSIPSGQGDNPSDFGYMVRAAITAKKPLIRATQGGERGAAGVGPGYRSAFIDGATDVIWEYATNDFYTGDGTLSAAFVMSTTLVAAAEAASRGARFWVQTIFPRNNSTDNWATLANQTFDTNITAQRTIYNDWVRAGCPVDANGQGVPAGTSGSTPSALVSGYVDVADAVENSRNDNKWKVNGSANYLTADGTHPTAAGHILAAAPIVALMNS
jgi:hypothetical protein